MLFLAAKIDIGGIVYVYTRYKHPQKGDIHMTMSKRKNTIVHEELDVENLQQTGLETVTIGQLHAEGRLQAVLDGTKDYHTALLLQQAIELLEV